MPLLLQQLLLDGSQSAQPFAHIKYQKNLEQEHNDEGLKQVLLREMKEAQVVSLTWGEVAIYGRVYHLWEGLLSIYAPWVDDLIR